jgi:hypothetical protein
MTIQTVRRNLVVWRRLVSLTAVLTLFLALGGFASASVGLLKIKTYQAQVWALASDYSIRAMDENTHTWTTYLTNETGTVDMAVGGFSLGLPDKTIFLIWGSGSGDVWGFNMRTYVWTPYVKQGVTFKKIVAFGRDVYAISYTSSHAGDLYHLDMSTSPPSWTLFSQNHGLVEIAWDNGYIVALGGPATGPAYSATFFPLPSGFPVQFGPSLGYKISGNANDYSPLCATTASSNPLYMWDGSTWQAWPSERFGRPVYEMTNEAYTTMYVLSTPTVGSGKSLWSHAMYGSYGGWTQLPLPN